MEDDICIYGRRQLKLNTYIEHESHLSFHDNVNILQQRTTKFETYCFKSILCDKKHDCIEVD